MKAEFLFCEELKSIPQGKEVIQLAKRTFFAKHNLSIATIGSVSTDGAPTLLGKKSGFYLFLIWLVTIREYNFALPHGN